MNAPLTLDHLAPTTDISEQFNELLRRRLTPHNLTTFADEAFESLVALVETIIAAHSTNGLTGVDQERAAMVAAGLDPNLIEQTLDHIAAIAETTGKLDVNILAKKQHVDAVLVPPDEKALSLGDGTGEFIPAAIMPKLKTLLLILQSLNVNSENDIAITTGTVDPHMMRNTSYDLVEIPSLQRTVLTCDEIGNITFVFDTAKAEEAGLAIGQLMLFTKDELKNLIDTHHGIGQTARYDDTYVSRLTSLLAQDIPDTETPCPTPNQVNILNPDDDTLRRGQRRKELLQMNNEQLVELWHEVAPGKVPTQRHIAELSKQGSFTSADTIRGRFGSMVGFQEACGYERRIDWGEYTDEQLVATWHEVAPGDKPTQERIAKLSKQRSFASYETIVKRFGSLSGFQEKVKATMFLDSDKHL